MKDLKQSDPRAYPDGDENISRDCDKVKSHFQSFLTKSTKLKSAHEIEIHHTIHA
jgi:hypothetical protein